jgi:hypothetical protein
MSAHTKKPKSKTYAKLGSVPGNYWKNLRCNGCSLECKYRDFKVFDSDGFQQMQQELKVETDDPEKWKYKRRGSVLGIMHETKRELWEQMTLSCRFNKHTQIPGEEPSSPSSDGGDDDDGEGSVPF